MWTTILSQLEVLEVENLSGTWRAKSISEGKQALRSSSLHLVAVANIFNKVWDSPSDTDEPQVSPFYGWMKYYVLEASASTKPPFFKFKLHAILFCSKVSSHCSSPSSQAGKSPGRAPPPWSPPPSPCACSSTTPSPPPPAPPHFGHRPHSHKWSDRAPARFHFNRLIMKVSALQTFK